MQYSNTKNMNIELEFIKQSRDPIRFIEKNRFGFNSQTHKDEILKLFNFVLDKKLKI